MTRLRPILIEDLEYQSVALAIDARCINQSLAMKSRGVSSVYLVESDIQICTWTLGLRTRYVSAVKLSGVDGYTLGTCI